MKCNLYPILRPLFTIIIKVLYRPKIINKEFIPKKGSLVIAGNHVHAFDPVLIGSCTKRTMHYLAKKELYKGVKSIFFNLVGTLPVDRKSKNEKTIGKAEEKLKCGGVIGIFPEGTRNRTSEDLLPFKKGAVNFAKHTNALIVPVAITGEYKIFGNNLTIRFGKPYKVISDDLDKENEKLRNKISKLKKEGNK